LTRSRPSRYQSTTFVALRGWALPLCRALTQLQLTGQIERLPANRVRRGDAVSGK
jgi:hypothetical protein